MKGKRRRWYSRTVQVNTCRDKKIEHVKRKQVDKASKSTTKSFSFMKGKGENGNDGSNRCYPNGETMMRTSGSMEYIAERLPTWYMFVVV